MKEAAVKIILRHGTFIQAGVTQESFNYILNHFHEGLLLKSLRGKCNITGIDWVVKSEEIAAIHSVDPDIIRINFRQLSNELSQANQQLSTGGNQGNPGGRVWRGLSGN